MALEARVIAFEIGEELIQPRNLAELCSAFQLIAEEEEQIVFDDWTTNRAAKLVANVFWLQRLSGGDSVH